MSQTIQQSNQQARPWGILPSIGFSILVFIAFLGIQTFAIAIYAYLQIQNHPGVTLSNLISALANDGLAISVTLIPGALVGSLLVILFASLRQNITLKDYLKLKVPSIKQVFFWIVVLIIFSLGMEFLNYYLDRPTPTWMVESYKTAGIIPLFWFTLVVAAPVFEELLFRGFLLEGLRHSIIGNLGAVVITAVIWAVIHIQYEMFEVVAIFLIGLILGYARIKTDSLYTPIILHALMNLAATAQIASLGAS